MNYKVIISEKAHNDIDDALNYIINTLCNPIAAKSLLNEIEKAYSDIAINPETYAYCSDPRLRKDGYRKFIIKNYIMIYRIDEINKIAYIVRFFYGKRNYTEFI